MPQGAPGIDPTRVDTVAVYPLGYEIGDPRGGVFAGNQIKYCRANGTITAADAVRLDVTASPAADRKANVIRTSAAAQVLEGVSNVSLTTGQFGWVTVLGVFPSANVVNATAAGAILASSGVAGQFITSPGLAADANAQSAGRRAIALTAASGNLADVLIGG